MLGWCKTRCLAKQGRGVLSIYFVILFGDSKVNESNLAVVAKHNVPGLYVKVEAVCGVYMGKGFGCCADDSCGFGLSEHSLFYYDFAQ